MGKYKRLFFFFSILLAFFIFKIDTYALWTANKPTWVNVWDGNNITYGTGTLTGVALDGQNFYAFNYSDTMNKVQFNYNGLPSGWSSSKYYDVSFQVFIPNINAGSGGIPIVLFNGTTCQTKTAIRNGITVYGTGTSYPYGSQIVSAYCPNVNVYGAFAVNVFTASGNSTQGDSSSTYYGISQEWSYSPIGDNNDVVNSINGVNSSINETNDKLNETNSKLDENKESVDKNTEAVDKQTDTIKDSDTTEASDSATSFFNDFEDNDYGLSDVVKMPLQFISNFSTSQCTNLVLPLPFVDNNISLPCMYDIYNEYFPSFLSIYQLITNGIIAYWVCINLFAVAKGLKDPDSDKVEVFDL